MKREEFKQITADILTNILEDMEKNGVSGLGAVVTTLTLTMFISKLDNRLFNDEEEIEIER